MGLLGSALYPDALRSLASASVSSSYQAVGTTFTNPIRIMKITNNSTQDITISWDGLTDHEYIPAGSFLLLDVSSNAEFSRSCEISSGTQILAKGTAGTGTIYISTYYVR